MSARTVIVNHHYCVSDAENLYLARTAVEPARFQKQIERLANLRLEQGIEPLVTFDDGTRDIWRNAIPALVQHRIPSILFCCTLPLLQKRLLNVTKVHLLQGKLGFPEFRSRFLMALRALDQPYELEDVKRLGLGQIFRYDTEDVREFKLLLNVKLPYTLVTALLDALFEPEFGRQDEAAKFIYMSTDEILRARDAGIRIGLHTHSHFMLARLSPVQQQEEIVTCREFFCDLLGDDTFDMSYPHGVPGTWNDTTKAIMARLGIPRAYTLGREIYDPSIHCDAYEIPRYDVNDVFEKDGTLRPAAEFHSD